MEQESPNERVARELNSLYTGRHKKPLSGFHWQPMGSDSPAWVEGYEEVSGWFTKHASDESVFDSLLQSVQETLERFKAGSKRQVDLHLKLNTANSTIKLLATYDARALPAFTGHEGRIVLGDEETGETLAERSFFIFMHEGIAQQVIPRAQIL